MTVLVSSPTHASSGWPRKVAGRKRHLRKEMALSFYPFAACHILPNLGFILPASKKLVNPGDAASEAAGRPRCQLTLLHRILSPFFQVISCYREMPRNVPLASGNPKKRLEQNTISLTQKSCSRSRRKRQTIWRMKRPSGLWGSWRHRVEGGIASRVSFIRLRSRRQSTPIDST